MKRTYIFLSVLCMSVVSSGCSSLSKEFENRLACSSDGKAYVISMYGPLGVASKIDTLGACIQGVQK